MSDKPFEIPPGIAEEVARINEARTVKDTPSSDQEIDLEAQLAALHVRCARAETRVERLVKVCKEHNDLPKKVVYDAKGREFVRIPYVAYATWDVSRRAASEVPA